jgi:hypothetical protein
MSKPPPEPAVDPSATEEAALCQHELDARRENEMRAKRKRDIEPPGKAGKEPAR